MAASFSSVAAVWLGVAITVIRPVVLSFVRVLTLAGVLVIGPSLVSEPLGGGSEAQAASVVLGGKRVTCGKGSFAWASNVPGIGLSMPSGIVMDRRLKGMHPDLQRFVFLHECAHQRGVTSESGADCWAIRRGVYRRLFTKKSVLRLCAAFWNTSGGAVHLPGPARCRSMAQCFASKQTQRVR